MTDITYSLNIPPVSPVYFWISVSLLFLISAFLTLYMTIFVWNFGQAMRKYYTARIQKLGMIQEYDHEQITLHLAEVKNNIFRALDETTVIKPHWWSIGRRVLSGASLIGKSILSINGVPTLLVWNVTPKLPERYIKCLEVLSEKGLTSVTELVDALHDHESGVELTDIIIPEITIKDFLELHETVKSRYSISVTIDDVLNFSDKYLDEHPRKSLIEKIVTAEKRKLLEKKFQKWAFYIIGSEILGGFIILAYKVVTT